MLQNNCGGNKVELLAYALKRHKFVMAIRMKYVLNWYEGWDVPSLIKPGCSFCM